MDTKLVVAAIDFGTTYSGWAYSFKYQYQSDPTKVYSKLWYPVETDPTYKAPTAILIKPDGKTIEAFGYEAENKFSEWNEEGTHVDYFFFSKFKMALHLDIESAKDLESVEIHDHSGKPLNALIVCSLTIQYLYQDGEKYIVETINTRVCPSIIHWVLTVPAIWTDAAKQFMQKAAIQAGIPSDRLTLALEPEAAAALYRHLPRTAGTSGFKEFKTGERYMVLDAGEVTVDITVHEIDRSGGIKEVIAANGGGWGGNLVNDAFHAFIEESFEDGIYKTFKQEHGDEWLEFDREFERNKRTVDQSCKQLTIRCPFSLAAENPQYGTVSLRRNRIHITGDTAKAFFKSFIENMLGYLTTLLQRPELNGISSILMVGEYSEYPMLQQSLKDAFPNLTFICLPDAGMSILKGAVIFGHNPSVITGRVLKYTYGIDINEPFKVGEHDEHDGDVSHMAPKLVVAAIDFGTTYSGWAFSFAYQYQSDPSNLYSKKDRPCKVPTAILIKPDGKTIEAFGHDAEKKWKEGTHVDYFFFSKFKMALNLDLESAKDLDSVEIYDQSGRPLNALTVCSLTIQYLYQDGTNHIVERINTGLCPRDIHWVLTVPAIWTDAAKQFMRKAAIQAGIPSNRLTFALEPEAAAVVYRHLTVTTGTSGFKEFKTGERYMVLDAGGGTVDITVHEIDRSGGIKEIIAANGGGWGGNLVNDAFHAFFEKLYENGIYKTFKQEHGDEWLEFDRKFEKKKTTVDQNCESLIIRCPHSLKETKPKDGTVCIKRDKIHIKGDTAKAFFKSSIEKIVMHFATILQRPELEGISSILMAGGYSDSPMIEQSLKEAFPNLTFIFPPEAGLSILKGAVIFGHNPSVITGRVLKYTYGVAIHVAFEEGEHDKSKKVKTDKGVYCKDIFSKHAEIYQAVKVGEHQQTITYYPVHQNQKAMPLGVYASKTKNPKYVDSGCVHLGEFKVDMSDLDGDLKRKVTCRFTFSDTEILVDAACVKTGKKAEFKRSYLQ